MILRYIHGTISHLKLNVFFLNFLFSFVYEREIKVFNENVLYNNNLTRILVLFLFRIGFLTSNMIISQPLSIISLNNYQQPNTILIHKSIQVIDPGVILITYH